MFLPMGIGFTTGAGIATVDVSKAPVNHAIPVKVLILSISHLAQPEMLAIGIDGFNTPI